MEFALALDLTDVAYYGRIPELPHCTGPKAEVFKLDEDDWPLLDRDFVDQVNALCGTWLDDGDADFFDVERCKTLVTWLESRLEEPIGQRLTVIYAKLLDYAKRAIVLGTGIVVEL